MCGRIDRGAHGYLWKGKTIMADFYFWFLFVLLVIMILAWPTWPYTATRWPFTQGGAYRYAPSAAAAAIILLLLILFWVGLIAIAWPWAATVPTPVVVQ